MNYNEMKQAVNLLSKEWNLGKKEAETTSDICAWIYLLTILEESEKIIKYKEKNKLIGFSGYSKNNSNKHIISKKIYSLVKFFLYKSKKIKNIKALKEYEMNCNYTPKELEKYFDGEVSILIVDRKYREKGIGKYLLQEVFNKAIKDNLKNLQILTDESCNYNFYESLGCKKIYETIIFNKEEKN